MRTTAKMNMLVHYSSETDKSGVQKFKYCTTYCTVIDVLVTKSCLVQRKWQRDTFINQLLVELWLEIWTRLILVQSPEIHIQIHSWKTNGKKISFPCPFNFTPFPFLHSHINTFDSSVGYLWHFCTDPDADPDPRIRTFWSGCLCRRPQKWILRFRIRMQIRTLVHLHHSSKMKSHEEVTKQ